MKKLLSVILAVMLVITACPLLALADEHTVRTEALILGSESISNEQEGWSYDASSNTLVLNNVTIDRSDADCDGLCISAGYNLNLVLEGESTLISKTDYMVKAINAKSNLSISGTGTLNINESNRAINSKNMVIDSGTINITHDKSLYEGDANAMIPIVGIVNISAVNGGTVNSDAACMISEVNGGELNVSEIASSELTVNGGEINADMIVATDITVNNGLVNVSGGSAYDVTYYYNGYDNNQFGIVCEKAFEINGGTVNTNGDDVTALYANKINFNGGSFYAQSNGAAVLAQSYTNKSSNISTDLGGISETSGTQKVNPEIVVGKKVTVSEPVDYTILEGELTSFANTSEFDEPDIENTLSFFSADETQFISDLEYNSETFYVKLTTNAAKSVAVTERVYPDKIVLDRNGGTWADCFDAQGADELENGIYGKLEKGWRYDTATNTLYLNNATIDCSSADADGTCISAADDLNIVLEGESTLKSRTVVASGPSYINVIQFYGNLNISGTGTLNIEEGNNAFRSFSDSQFVIDGGVINITHDFDSYEVEGTSTNFVFGNNNKNTIINDGEINSDVNFALEEINGGVINVYGIISKLGLIINSGEINADAIFVSKDLVVNDGAVSVFGGNIKTFIGEYIAESTPFGIFAIEAFEMNGGEVYTHGSAFGLLCGARCSFNGGRFVAESEGAAVVSAAVVSSGVDPSINISDNVKIAEPESYAIHSVQSENGVLDPKAATNGVSIWDSSVEEPYFEFDNDTQTASTNAAKRVVITEVEHRTLKFNDENGDETYKITVTENDYDRLLSDVISEQLNVPQENLYIVFGYAADDTVSKYLELVDGMAEESYDVNGELIIDTVWGTGDTYNSDWLGDYENTSEYHIKDARDFAAFKKSCFVDGNRFEGKTVYLDNDVDLGEHFWYVGASKVVTDDGSTNYPKFSGVFDGCGHAVTGLKMFPVGGIATAGLFPFLKNAVVKNLSVDGVAMRSNLHWLGLLAGYAVDSAVYNCFASGTIECVGRERNYDPGSTGALIGEAQHCAVINCGADADISLDYEHIVKHNYSGGMPKLGVLIGEATTKVEESFCVINCYSHGSISVLNTFQSAKVGGLIGVADDDLYNCYTDVQLTPNRPYSMYGTLVGELHAENVLNNAGQDGDNLGQYIIGNLFYPQGAQPFGWNNSVFHNTARRDVSEFASAYEDAEELCAALNAGAAQVDEIISAHRDVLADSSWADLLEQCNGGEVEAMHWCISEADNMPTFGYSYKGFIYTVNDNEIRIDGYNGNNTNIIIPSKIFGIPVTSIKKQAFKGMDLSTVVIPSGLTSIGDEAFIDCKELTSVDIPDTVSYIGYGAFMRCEKLSDITLPSGISKIKHDTFNGCKALKSIVISENVEDIFGYAFAGCLALESVTFNDGLKNIALDAFNNCSALTSIDIPDSVTEIGNAAFFNCTNLADINIPNSVISIGHGAFKNTEYYYDENNWENNALYINNVLIVVDNKALEGEFEVKDGTRMIADYALFGCLKVTSLVLPGSVTHYGDSSLADMGILTLKIPEGAVVLGRGAINCCFDLEELTVPTSVTSIGSAFASNCHSLTDVYYLGTAAEWELIDCNEYSSFTTGGTSEVVFHFADDEPELITGWQYIDVDWYYYNADGEIVTGWLKDGGKWYYLDEDGVMQTGWIKDGSIWYYLNKSGAMQTGWLKDGNNWYYLKSSGAMATGWVKDGGKWYYLKSSGAMATGWIKDGGKWYYLESNGAMRTANLTYKGKVYKFNSSGACINP